MKELFTKSFWRDAKKTFYTALEGPPPENKPSQVGAQTDAEGNPTDAPNSETPTAPPNGGKQN